MDDFHAIYARHSVRSYLPTPIDGEVREALLGEIEAVNSASGLHVQLIDNNPDVFRTVTARATGLISARHHLAMVGREDEDFERRIGYWGQLLVLRAQTLGLNTNWTGGTMNRSKSRAVIGPGERNAIVIAIGYGENQGTERKTKSVERLSRIEGEQIAPEWFWEGMRAAQAAPTGLNVQDFRIVLQADGCVRAERVGRYPLGLINLGIVMRNFEIGAGVAKVRWVNPVMPA